MRKSAFGIVISILLIIIIFKATETIVTWKKIFQVNLTMLAFAFFLHSLFWLFWAFRLKILASFLNQKVSLGYSLKTTLASTFLAAITPSSAGGEPLRVKMLADRGASIGSASAVVLAERLLDAAFFISALPVFLIFSGFSMKLGFEVGFVFFVFLLSLILFLYLIFKKPERSEILAAKLYPVFGRLLSANRAERVYGYIQRELRMFRNAAVEISKDFKQLAVVMLLTSLIWIFEFLVPSAILIALREDPAFLFSITSQLIIVIVSLLPITPGSSGIAEAGMFYLYQNFVPHHTLGILVALWRIITYFLNLIVGFFVIVKIFKSKYI